MKTSWRLACLVATVAFGIIAISSLRGDGALGLLMFGAYALIPYLLLLAAGWFVRNPWIIGGAGTAALAAEIGVRLSVFVFPTSSTSALVLIFSPVFIVMVVLPVGALLGYVSGRLWQGHGLVVRTGVAMFWIASVGLTLIAFGRPDLFPTTVVHRHSMLERIGPPRVATGSDGFETAQIFSGTAWYTTGDFDEAPGEEIAIVSYRAADLLDPTTFVKRGRLAFEGNLPQKWNWFSRLVRLDGTLAVAQTGGGFSETEVLALDGSLRWRYRPKPDLATSAMLPADLDGDGQIEFYASPFDGTVRLDSTGHEVWRHESTGGQVVAVAPRRAESPGWVVSQSGRGVAVWDENGKSLADLPSPEDRRVLAVVDWPRSRALVLGGTTASGIDLAGRTQFDVPLGDFSLTHAVAVSFRADAPPYLALAGEAPRDVKRWRLLVLSPDRAVVFDQIFGDRIALLTARRADGGETLLVSDDHGLRSLRPRS
jgi:hypothetical protein